jgi:hypothetical protein
VREHGVVQRRPSDLDTTRAAIAAKELTATASGYLTADVAMHLPFASLTEYKTLLKRFFSPASWSRADEEALDGAVSDHIGEEWWEHDLGGGIVLAHGRREGAYRLWVTGHAASATSIFDRAFDGPVVPEPTPHPRKVKFAFGGPASPGRWYRRGDPDPPDDARARRLLAEPDVTDVMVAGDFVTIGLAAKAPWEQRLEPLLALVSELFAAGLDAAGAPERTREELMAEAGHLHARAGPQLHLLDPNDAGHRPRLIAALDDEDPRTRRVAVAILAESDEPAVRSAAVHRGYTDASRIVRRTAVDAAADTEDPGLRPFFEEALDDGDAWIRWRAARALGALGGDASLRSLEALRADPEFRVRFEAEAILRRSGGTP